MEKTVNINWDGNNLTIDPEDLELGDEDWVWWSFAGMEEGDFGFVSFQDRFGPFHSLQSFTNAGVLGKGNVGLDNGSTYPYWAMILDPNSNKPIASAQARVKNLATKRDTTPEVLVYYKSDTQTLEVTPDPLRLNTGDTATWYFMNLPPGAFACFQFEPVVFGMNEAFGPFTTFYASGGNVLANVRASGTGFASRPEIAENPVLTYTYKIQLRDSQGNQLASHDPAIDNLGPPPPPPGSGEEGEQ